MKYSQGVILLTITLGCIQVSTQNNNKACGGPGYLGQNIDGTAPFCDGHAIGYYDSDPQDGSWDKYYFAYGEKGKVPYHTSSGKDISGSECWSGKKHAACWASHARFEVSCSQMCSFSGREKLWEKGDKESKGSNSYFGYTPPGLFPIRTDESAVTNNIPLLDWPYIIGAEIIHGSYKDRDGKDKTGSYVSYCWCNWPQIKYEGPKLNHSIDGEDASNFHRENPPYNLNSLKGAMDWCSSQAMKDCGGVLAIRHFPEPLQFIAKKGSTLIPSTIGEGKHNNETFENAYVRGAALNPKAPVTNRMEYL